MRPPVHPTLKRFIWDIQSMVELDDGERAILMIGRDLMNRLLAVDDWLPAVFAQSDTATPQCFSLFEDMEARFRVVATVLAPGQALAVRQDKVWEIFGQLRGSLDRQRLLWPAEAEPAIDGGPKMLKPGSVETAPAVENLGIRLTNPSADAVSIGIQVFGSHIGRINRYAVDPEGKPGAALGHHANPEEAPAYDIWSIQTEIVD